MGDRLDELLSRSAPRVGADEADAAAVDLARAVAARQRRFRFRHRRSLIAGGLSAALVLGGGATAWAAVGGLFDSYQWVEGPDREEVHEVVTADGSRERCSVAFKVAADYGAGHTNAEAEAAQEEGARYLRDLDLDAVTPSADELDLARQGARPSTAPPPEMDAWVRAVFAKLDRHVQGSGLPGVSMNTVYGDCEAS
ncbi:hypothetical protein [Schumannella sp. 10F1B-5-1]|uniref:hypothetical protein n=1 Tax=Schumannella sp. 10F1B-5-1 TaxID=2590780 RepID=UPI001130DF0A|nr:hypothetical protein [Schumannella sp. 10F1B-5-1]TPW76722.1 hypothetical protein FJ658_01915 [Schumannella sp. 10F1B-5-1]